MRHLPIFLLAALLFALPALATDDIWVTTPQGTTACKVEKDKVCYYDTSTTGATAIQTTANCHELTASFVSDISDNTLKANTAQVFRFFGDSGTSTAADASDDEAILTENKTLDGDSSTSTDAIYAFDAPRVYFRVTNSSGTSRAVLHCWQ